MPIAREDMDALLGKFRTHMLNWEKADPGTATEQAAAADMSSAMAALDDSMCHGAELPTEWLAGQPDEPERPSWERDMARRYMEARYDEGWMYRAPESYPNILERWLWAVASGNGELAGECMLTIEEGLRQDRNMKASEAARRT